jgi:predicted transcriptional regulator
MNNKQNLQSLGKAETFKVPALNLSGALNSFQGGREMAGGYNGYSKSNRAIQAEADGKMTVSTLAKRLKVSTAAVKEFCKPCEHHHTSSWFNCTNYYEETDLLLAAQGEQDPERFDGEKEEAYALLKKMRAFNVKSDARTFAAAKVKWLEWSGSRAHPKATEMIAENIQVTVKGQFATLHLPNGDLRKKIDARGFSITEEPPLSLTGTGEAAAQV